MFKSEAEELIEVSRRFIEMQGLQWIGEDEFNKRLERGMTPPPCTSVPIIETIKAAIKAWPCSKCGGRGRACYTLGGICEASRSGPWSEWCINKCANYEKTKPCPDCLEGKRDMWPLFKGWIMLLNFSSDQPIEKWPIKHADKYEVLTTPLLLMQAFLAFLDTLNA